MRHYINVFTRIHLLAMQAIQVTTSMVYILQGCLKSIPDVSERLDNLALDVSAMQLYRSFVNANIA